MAKQRKGVGLTSFATGFAKGASQGMQMGMYRAMQQQKAGETENEKKAKEILGYKTGIKDPKILSELTIIAQELRRGIITPDEADNLMDAKGLTGPAGYATPPKPGDIEVPEEEYHTFVLTGKEPYTRNNRTHQPGDHISVAAIEGKISTEAGGLKGSPFQLVGKTSTATGITPTVERKTAKDIEDRLRYIDTGDLVFPDVEPTLEAPEAKYLTFKHTGTEPYVYNNRTHQPGDHISVAKSDVDAGVLKDSPFQFVGKTSTAPGVTPKRATAKGVDNRLRFIDTGKLVFPDVTQPESGRIMTAAEVLAETSTDEATGASIPMPIAPPGQVWWRKPGEKPVLIGAAMRAEPKETFTKPQPFQKIGTQEIVYIGWDKNKNSFVLKGDTEDTSLTYAEVTTGYTPKSKDMFTQMMVEIMGQVVTQLKEEEE